MTPHGTFLDTVSRFVLPIRITQAVLAIITLGLSAYVANAWNHYYYYSSPSQVNFMIFNSIWTLLVLIYLIVTTHSATASFHRYGHKFAHLGLEAVTMLFWFAGFIALAVLFSPGSCRGPVCGSARAAAAFGAFEWILFLITTVVAAIHVFRTRGSRSTEPAPEMAAQPHASA